VGVDRAVAQDHDIARRARADLAASHTYS
jgi:hypothetical protein